MKPISFKEQNKVLKKPQDMTDEECGSLPVYNYEHQWISCWKGTWKDRLIFLFTGKVWLGVLSWNNQPPVWTTIIKPFTNELIWYRKKLHYISEKLSYYTGW